MISDPPRLERRTASSYGTPFAALLGVWLLDQGWSETDPRSRHELGRYCTSNGQLVIIYHSGSILVQGADADATRRLLDPLVGEL